MKKITLSILTAAMICLAACSRGGPAPTATPAFSPTPGPLDVLAASDTDTVTAAQTHVPPASATDLTFDEAAYNQALGFEGRMLQEMYAVLGQPVEMPVYVPSEDDPNAQIGTLPYNGFVVETLRTATSETVQRVYLPE